MECGRIPILVFLMVSKAEDGHGPIDRASVDSGLELVPLDS